LCGLADQLALPPASRFFGTLIHVDDAALVDRRDHDGHRALFEDEIEALLRAAQLRHVRAGDHGACARSIVLFERSAPQRPRVAPELAFELYRPSLQRRLDTVDEPRSAALPREHALPKELGVARSRKTQEPAALCQDDATARIACDENGLEGRAFRI